LPTLPTPILKNTGDQNFSPGDRSEAPAVDLAHLELIDVDAIQTSHVDGGHGLAGLGMLAHGERLNSTSRAEPVLDHVPIELVRRQIILAFGQLELTRGRKRQQAAQSAAPGAIAREDLVDVQLHLVPHFAALTAACV
jgi:hypothetical protein